MKNRRESPGKILVKIAIKLAVKLFFMTEGFPFPNPIVIRSGLAIGLQAGVPRDLATAGNYKGIWG